MLKGENKPVTSHQRNFVSAKAHIVTSQVIFLKQAHEICDKFLILLHTYIFYKNDEVNYGSFDGFKGGSTPVLTNFVS